jgi:predicted transcriptional regulator of viral defense system
MNILENITEVVREAIENFAYGYAFTASDFSIDVAKQKSVNKVLENLTKTGKIRRLSKGRYYKTTTTEFGELPPDSYQIVKDLLTENGKQIGYITGYQIFNELGLTTQVSAILQIGTIKDKKSMKRSYYRIKFVKQWNTITKDNILLLQLLDCLRFFKYIPDAMPKDSCQRLLYLLSELNENQKNKIKKLARKYTPQAIALLGAMLETLNPNENLEMLKNALNFQTFYSLKIPREILPTQKNWNIR